MKLKPAQIKSLNASYARWGSNHQPHVTEKGEGVILNAVYSRRKCGCSVTGNGTLQLPFTVKPCKAHK